MIPFRFYPITDIASSRHKPAEVLPELMREGLRALQVREEQLSPQALADYCVGLSQGLGEMRKSLALFLNDRADIALSSGFDGVHLRADSLPVERHAPALRDALLYGVSTHSLEEVLRAKKGGANFATFGPVFATPSKAAYGEPVGLKALEEAAAATSLPLLALGGVTPERTPECIAAGAHGVAVISALWNAESPLAALEQFREALGGEL